MAGRIFEGDRLLPNVEATRGHLRHGVPVNAEPRNLIGVLRLASEAGHSFEMVRIASALHLDG